MLLLFQLFVLPVLYFVHGQEQKVADNTLRQNQLVRAVQESYVKMKMAIMMDVNNELTVVDMKPVNRSGVDNRRRITLDLSNDVGFYFYSRKNMEYPVLYRSTNISDLANNELFNTTKNTIVLVHGYLNNLTSPMIQLNLKALLKYRDLNVIAVDWYQVMAKQDNVYAWCAEDTFPVGVAVGQAVSGLIRGGLKPSMAHFVGHSLGAHVVGVAGKFLKGLNQTIARITGLDPAKIEFEDISVGLRINAADAEYVDCIHSCGGYLGFDRPICQTDFYPNGGLMQPGCSFLGDICCVCSHGRSYHYFAESIKPKHIFPAAKCLWTSDGLLGCTDSPQMMGYPAKSEFKGAFYVKTMSDYPFSPAIERPPEYGWWSQLQAWLLSIRLIIS
uniref:Lipase member I n=3 Tax=Lygus hesperus TaxID=30085 RepID=A0A0A9YCU3_LYGHE